MGGPRRKFDSVLSFPSLEPEEKNQETLNADMLALSYQYESNFFGDMLPSSNRVAQSRLAVGAKERSCARLICYTLCFYDVVWMRTRLAQVIGKSAVPISYIQPI